jgi:hypothetical protein
MGPGDDRIQEDADPERDREVPRGQGHQSDRRDDRRLMRRTQGIPNQPGVLNPDVDQQGSENGDRQQAAQVRQGFPEK